MGVSSLETDEKFVGSSDKISPERWAEAMAIALRTPHDFPWESLGPYLYDLDEDGNISYFQFILRYHNPFFTWLTDRYIDSCLEWLMMVFDGKPKELFNAWEMTKDGRMHYREMQ